MNKKVFISYHDADLALVTRLDGDLQKGGISSDNLWMAERNLRGGRSRRQQLFEAIVASDCVIVCLSPDYLRNDLCRTQLFLARTYNKAIFPVTVAKFAESPIGEIITLGREHREIKGIEDLKIVDLSGNYMLGIPSQDYERSFEALMAALDPIPRPTPLNPHLIYISYGFIDRDFANMLARDLEEAGGLVWLDSKDIRVGDNMQREIDKGITTATYYILCLSGYAAESQYVRRELLVARLRNLHILPIIPERVFNSRTEMAYLDDAMNQSDELRQIIDIERVTPEPDYAALIGNARSALGLDKPEPTKKQGIFISYRRADAQATTGRLYSELVKRFPENTVFKDVEKIPVGQNFETYLADWLDTKTAVALVIIGRQWATIKEDDAQPSDPPRLFKEDDVLRMEVAKILEKREIFLIPVLVDGATMTRKAALPDVLQELSFRNPIQVRPDPDFSSDLDKLVEVIRNSQKPAST